jgi:dipeptidyl aminopeptidase/acylaminoacyl peptidase
MINWVAGQPLAKKFKAMVNHEGIFNLPGMLSCDIPTSLKLDLGADLWENQKVWDKQDPSRFTENWTQPMLIVHNDKDYRCMSSYPNIRAMKDSLTSC